MIRRFVNLVAEHNKTGVYSLHRLDASKHLFHQSRADARVVPILAGTTEEKSCDDEAVLDRLEELPAPCVKIHPNLRDNSPFWGMLSPRRSEDRFICMNRMGETMLCYGDRPRIDPMPPLQDDVAVRPISLSVARRPDDEEEDLYVIHNVPQRGSSCFRVLTKDAAADGGWRWEPLPSPPMAGAPRYDPDLSMYSYAVVDGGRTICFSCAAPGIGTYCFNTVEREWRHAGDWHLPFVGGAVYVPDLAPHCWLGFSLSSPSYLCATSDLNAMSVDHPPKLQYVWQQDLVVPKNWSPGRAILVSLGGSGRFCIARPFVIENHRIGESGDQWWEFEDEVTVLTGIEVGRDDDQGLKVWKHKSVSYRSMYTVSVHEVL